MRVVDHSAALGVSVEISLLHKDKQHAMDDDQSCCIHFSGIFVKESIQLNKEKHEKLQVFAERWSHIDKYPEKTVAERYISFLGLGYLLQTLVLHVLLLLLVTVPATSDLLQKAS